MRTSDAPGGSKAVEGGSDAIAEFHREQASRLGGAALLLVGDHASAEDVAQEASVGL
ncbi:hypothetical protein GCM10022254_41390 [Actinomadura meridiana]|uniref:Uncharacterized protein n=1 Tax=Actinomadura meridiana TaxID=559626 RepID=A0ABP8C7E8_9ACTN